MRLRRFGLPYRGSSSVQAVTQTGDNATNDHLRGAVGSDLQDSSNTHDRGAEQDRFLPTQPLSEGKGGHSAEETANVICEAQLDSRTGQFTRLDLHKAVTVPTSEVFSGPLSFKVSKKS